MYNIIKSGIRGGISQISQRYAEANNKEMGDSFDPGKPSNYILYMDANNLYGYAMMDYLPVGGYKWVEAKLHKATKNMDTYMLLIYLIQKNITMNIMIIPKLQKNIYLLVQNHQN